MTQEFNSVDDLIINGVVLLSGGLDSTAALFWAKQRYSGLRAFAVDYGQPNRDQELTAAGRAAREEGVEFTTCNVASALRPYKPAGLLNGANLDSIAVGNTDRAFVPGRNLLLATVAISHAATWWPTGRIDLIVGACAEDQAGFPDCRPTVFVQLAVALSAGLDREIRILAPWADMTKSQILYAIKPDARAMSAVARSYSCYRCDGPCGRCGACRKRAVAFDAQQMVDESYPVTMTGGDPARAVR